MDPQVCYQAYLDTFPGEDEHYEAMANLYEWLEKGGFEPVWTKAQRESFYDDIRTDAYFTLYLNS